MEAKLKPKMTSIIILLIFIVVPPILNIPNPTMMVFDLAAIYAIVALGLNILMGYAGQISLGHGAFLAIGAYTSAILNVRLGIPFWFTLPIAGLVTAFIGFLLGIPALRLKGHYLAIATMGFGVAVVQIAMRWDSLTGGYSGIKPEKPILFGYKFSSYLSYYYIILAVLVLLIILTHNIMKTKLGRSWMAMRDSESAAVAYGINLSYSKTVAFAISAFYTGLAGGLYGHLIGFMTPYDSAFSIMQSLYFLAMIVIGGMGSIPGSILGAVLITLLPEYTSRLPLNNLSQVLTGVILILVVMFFPNGLISLFGKIRGLFGNGRKREGRAEA